MKFSTREDIEAGIEDVFDALCDFEAFERQALRRGADIQRIDGTTEPAVGAVWKVSFVMRGRRRNMDLSLVRFERPNEMGFSAVSPGVNARFDIELLALSRNRTRMAIALDVSPLNLATRLLIQSMKLAKASLTKRFKQRVADYCKTLENRLQRGA